MKALCHAASGLVALADLPLPTPGEDEVLLRMAAALMPPLQAPELAHPWPAAPQPLGQAGVGQVVAAGRAVKHCPLGTWVVARPWRACGTCAFCQQQLSHLCREARFLGRDLPGVCAEYLILQASQALRLPPELPVALGALTVPLALALEAWRAARPHHGDSLLIVGDTLVGLLLTRLAEREPLGRVVVAGNSDWRLTQVRLALALNLPPLGDPQAVLRLAAGQEAFGYHAIIQASDQLLPLALGLTLLRPHGRLVLTASTGDDGLFQGDAISREELSLAGATVTESSLTRALHLLADPALALDQLLTHRRPLAEAPTALAHLDAASATQVLLTMADADALTPPTRHPAAPAAA